MKNEGHTHTAIESKDSWFIPLKRKTNCLKLDIWHLLCACNHQKQKSRIKNHKNQIKISGKHSFSCELSLSWLCFATGFLVNKSTSRKKSTWAKMRLIWLKLFLWKISNFFSFIKKRNEKKTELKNWLIFQGDFECSVFHLKSRRESRKFHALQWQEEEDILYAISKTM